MHILIVDDDPLLRKVLATMVEEAGHTTCWASNGEGALSHMRTENPDAVILDINLGKGLMSGWGVLREKLLSGRVRSIPVVILSGMTADEIHEGARVVDDALSGALVILGKPVSMDLMLAALRRLEESRPTDPKVPVASEGE